MQSFNRLHLQPGWRQFGEVRIDLSSQITVLTGANGCGKTTILNLLSKHFGWTLNLVSTPHVGKRKQERLWSDTYGSSSEIEEIEDGHQSIGQIYYSSGQKCELTTPSEMSAQYTPSYRGIQEVSGLHIPAHRQATAYNLVENIPTQPVSAAQEYETYQQLLTQFYMGGRVRNHTGSVQKKSLISLALFGEGNNHVAPNPEMAAVFQGFQDVLRDVLPDHLGFRRLEIRMPEVVLVTRTGDFALDAMSGGIAAIFGIAWQIYMFGYDKSAFTITLDEPENHLHPSMQRMLLPRLAKAFPNCRFIVATHSPFIVSSFRNAHVVALTKNLAEKFEAERVDISDISGTPNEVLREILDVGSNLPVWVEREIDSVINQASNIPADDRARFVMSRLAELGISDSIVEYNREDTR